MQEKEILFTSGGTESNNLAIIGSALANKKSRKTYNHFIGRTRFSVFPDAVSGGTWI